MINWLMRLNLDNCDVLQMTTRTQLQSKYAIHGQVQKNVTSAKYLGLNIYKTLSWDNHVNRVTQKAHNSNPPSQAETSAVALQTSTPMLFHTCKIIPGIRVYSLEPSKEKKHQPDRGSPTLSCSFLLLGLPRRTSSVTVMMKKLNWTPMEVRRNKAFLVIMFRIVYDLVDLPPATYLQQS
jgi:hypothetical protein